MWEKQTLSFFNIFEHLYENQQKSYISDIFWAFKMQLQIMHQATYIHCFFLNLINVFYMFSTLHRYLSILFSHFVFLLSPSFSYSSRHGTYSTIYNVWWFHYNLPVYHEDKKTLHKQNRYSSITIFNTKYELFFLPHQITFFLAFGQAQIFLSYHILINILIYTLYCDKKIF